MHVSCFPSLPPLDPLRLDPLPNTSFSLPSYDMTSETREFESGPAREALVECDFSFPPNTTFTHTDALMTSYL